MRRFYFTSLSSEEIGKDHIGNIRGARRYAKELANERKETIFINDCFTEEIEDCVNPDEEEI